MYISPVSSLRNSYIQKPQQVSFKAHYDGFKPYGNYGDGDRYNRGHIHNYSTLIRDLGLFQDMPKMLEEKFPDGVKIYDYGCSAGYEPVSISLGLHNYFTESEIKKYTPIFARDNDKKIIKKAQEFKLRFEDDEQKRLDSFKNINKNDFFVEHKKKFGQKTHDCKDVLKKEIIFEHADLFDDLDNDKLSDEPCVLLLRNAWQFMTQKGSEELAEKLHEKLQPGSIVIIGYHDVCSQADLKLLNAGFERVDRKYSVDIQAEKQKQWIKDTPWLKECIHDKSLDIQNFCFERK